MTEIGSLHERICGSIFNHIFRDVDLIILGFLLFDGIKLDAVFGLVGQFLESLYMCVKLIYCEFSVLLWEHYGFDQIEQQFGDVLLGQKLG